ncbi:LCP family protein [Nocardia yamanashiensis]|uniref:LCP family protein n=1 Tax=Nocardia yamanashiensis TaxID=209247 RepID=UPI001F4272AB|nr:LCP family protein [Nocardia yamanashiensis]
MQPQRGNPGGAARANGNPPPGAQPGRPQRPNAAPPQRSNAVPPQRGNAAPPPRGNAAPTQRGNPAPPQRGNPASPQRGNASPQQRGGAPQRSNAAAPQRQQRPPERTRKMWSDEQSPPTTYGEAREAAPVTHAPTQRPVPYRESTPPPPPSRPAKRGGRGEAPRPKRPKRKRHWFRWILVLLLLILLMPIGAAIYVDTHLTRIDALTSYSGRPGDTPGTNWLLVGSDSRAGLSTEQEQELSTGGEVGSERTDTIILVHVPESGKPTLVSLPRDSYVSIPGHGKDKLNASFAFGGPQLLVQTVEGATGLRIDHYAQIGFGGFAGIVDAVGGIDMCLDEAIDDPLAGIDLKAGCQTLSGKNALGFVRSRATPTADLQRMLNQRKFLSALLKKASSPSTLLNPFRAWPLVTDTTAALKVDNGAHVWNLASLGRALSGDPVATTVPVGGFTDVDGSGNVLLWDKTKASKFFEALAADQQIPSDLITTVPN